MNGNCFIASLDSSTRISTPANSNACEFLGFEGCQPALMAKYQVIVGIVMISILLVRLFCPEKTLFKVVLLPYRQIERPPRYMELQPATGRSAIAITVRCPQ